MGARGAQVYGPEGAVSMAYDIIPQPKKMRPGKGGFAAGTTTTMGFTGTETMGAAYLAEAMWERTDLEIAVEPARGKGHALWMTGKADGQKLAAAAARLLSDAPEKDEAYALIVSEKGVAAAANSQAGLFYAATTAAQLVEKRDGRPFLAACEIIDWPDLAFRAVHIDLKHHMERYEYLVSLVRRLAAFKINGIVLELEDKFLYERRPEISAPVGLSAEDLRSLVSVCRQFHIELVPLVQGLGHVSYILKHAKYASLREKADSLAEFCPQAEGTYKVLFDLYEEVAAATEGTKYFHIGGDEAWLMGKCPRCAKAVAKGGKFPLYKKWLDKCAGKVRALGRIPMVWDDMLIKDAGDNWGKLPKDLFYVRWNYYPRAAEMDREKIQNYARSGLRVIVAASVQTNGPYVPMYGEHLANIDGFGKAAAEAGLAGILTTTWEDSGNHTESFWPGLLGTAQASWNPSVDLDYEYLVKFTRVFHGATDAKLAAVYKTLGEGAMKCFQLLTAQEPYRCEETIALPALEPKGPGERWRDVNAERITTATTLAATLREARKVLSAEILSGKRDNAYALETLLAATRVMLARVELFFGVRDAELAIEEGYAAFAAGDRARASKVIHDAAVGIYDALAAGEGALSSLEAVWLQTRMPQDVSLFETDGQKYVHDFNNYGHLAAKTRDLSYMIFVERRCGAFEMAQAMMRGSSEMLSARTWPLGSLSQ